jgi:hypothetical protein
MQSKMATQRQLHIWERQQQIRPASMKELRANYTHRMLATIPFHSLLSFTLLSEVINLYIQKSKLSFSSFFFSLLFRPPTPEWVQNLVSHFKDADEEIST